MDAGVDVAESGTGSTVPGEAGYEGRVGEIRGYTVLSLLGAGGMGSVHLARQESLGRLVALKRLGATPSAKLPNLSELIEREGRALARLDHPSIVRIYDLISADGDLFIVMEYVPGPALPAVVARGNLTRGQVLDLISHVAGALHHAHERGVIHCDVKPSNVLLAPSGLAKLGDFGVARLLGVSGALREGTVYGTPAYMAPERMSGERDVDRRTDVYSLGLTARELLVNRSPGAAVTAVHAAGGAAMPLEVEQALHDACHPDRRRRTVTVAEFWRRLEAAADRAWPNWRADAPAQVASGTAATPAHPRTTGVATGAGRPPTALATATARVRRPPARSARRFGAAPTALAALTIAAMGLAAFLLGTRSVTPAQPIPIAVTGVALAVEPADTVGHCPMAEFRFGGRIVTNGAEGTVAYQWIRPDGQLSPTSKLHLRPRTRAAAVSLQFVYDGTPPAPVSGSTVLHVLSPSDVYSRPISVTFACP